MIIKKIETEPRTVEHEIDRVVIETYHNSQSTDYGIKFFTWGNKNPIHEEEVDSINDGIQRLVELMGKKVVSSVETDANLVS